MRDERTAALIVTLMMVGFSVGCSGAEGDRGPVGPEVPAGEAGEAGPPGVRGPKGEPGADGAPGLRWRGPWSADETYAAGDVVRHAPAGGAYVAQVAAPDAPPPDPEAWGLLAADGDEGPAGPPGAPPERTCPEEMTRFAAGLCIEDWSYGPSGGRIPADLLPLDPFNAMNVCHRRGRRLCTHEELVMFSSVAVFEAAEPAFGPADNQAQVACEWALAGDQGYRHNAIPPVAERQPWIAPIDVVWYGDPDEPVYVSLEDCRDNTFVRCCLDI